MRYNVNYGYGQGNMEAKIATFEEMKVGGRGCDYIFDTQVHTRNYYEIVALSNNSFLSAATFFPSYSGTITTNNILSSIPLFQGASLKGDFSSVQMRSGSALGYFMY